MPATFSTQIHIFSVCILESGSVNKFVLRFSYDVSVELIIN